MCIDFYLDWTCDGVSQYVMFNTITLCINSIIFLHWFNLIRSSLVTQSNWFLLTRLHWVHYYDSIQLISIWRLKKTEFHSPFRITFNSLDSNVIPFTFHLEDGEIRSQSCSDEHDWFSPDLTWNTRVWWCPNIIGSFNSLGFPTA